MSNKWSTLLLQTWPSNKRKHLFNTGDMVMITFGLNHSLLWTTFPPSIIHDQPHVRSATKRNRANHLLLFPLQEVSWLDLHFFFPHFKLELTIVRALYSPQGPLSGRVGWDKRRVQTLANFAQSELLFMLTRTKHSLPEVMWVSVLPVALH